MSEVQIEANAPASFAILPALPDRVGNYLIIEHRVKGVQLD
jgi:hypothetical protein